LPVSESRPVLSLLAGRLRMTARHVVDGALKSEGIVPAIFWRDRLAVHVVEGRAEVTPLKSLDPGEYEYTLSARDIRMLWPAQGADRRPKSTKEWLTDEVARRRVVNDIPTGRGALTKFSEQLSKRTVDAKKAGEIAHTVSPRRLEALLRELNLWSSE
jgi:hypothetical protein